ncbi:Uncharacterized protein Rs2_19429 [Raphanus sativus]|nr:Uncharacterized protein Rs2_19429 [Raphanus sativus]
MCLILAFYGIHTEARRYRAVKTIVCLIFREGEATTAPSPPVLVAERRKFRQLRRRQFKLPGSEGYVSLTSPVSDVQGYEASPLDEILIEGGSSPTRYQEGEEVINLVSVEA